MEWSWGAMVKNEILTLYLHRSVGFFDEFDGLDWDLQYFDRDHHLVVPIIFVPLNFFVIHLNHYFVLDASVVYWLALLIHIDIGFGFGVADIDAADADADDLVCVKLIVSPLPFLFQYPFHLPLLPIFVNVQYPADDRLSHWWHHKRTKRSDWSLVDTYFGSRIWNGRFDTVISYIVWHFRLIHNLIVSTNQYVNIWSRLWDTNVILKKLIL